jgi:hypothetical protein
MTDKTKNTNIVVLKDLTEEQKHSLEIIRNKFDQRTNSKAVWTCVNHFIKLLEYQDLFQQVIKNANQIQQNIGFIQSEVLKKQPNDD